MKMRFGKTRAGGDSRDRRAFTLIEMVIALGIVSFALLGMMALLPAGVQATKTSLAESGAIDVLSDIIADRKATIPTLPSITYAIPGEPVGHAMVSNCFGITPANVPTTTYSQSNYRVTYEIISPTAGINTGPSVSGTDPYVVYFKVSWPAVASSTNAPGYVEQTVTIPQP
jgi:prepilin-type N-terminal cleavage/methylation domain-containing protein